MKSEIFVSLIHRGEVDGDAQYSQEEMFPNDLFTGQECPDFLFKCHEDDFGVGTSIRALSQTDVGHTNIKSGWTFLTVATKCKSDTKTA